jgi:hypothetical protein
MFGIGRHSLFLITCQKSGSSWTFSSCFTQITGSKRLARLLNFSLCQLMNRIHSLTGKNFSRDVMIPR